MATDSSGEGNSRPSPRLSVRRFVRFFVVVLIPPAALFFSAGHLGWWQAWAYVGIGLLFIFLSRVAVLRRSPDLLAERGQFTQAGSTKGWDRLIVLFAAILGPTLVCIVAGLDERLGWAPSVPVVVDAAAAVVMVLGYCLSTWAMLENKYFSVVARIQKDRGHTTVMTGPYRFVRHPAYAGGVVYSLAGTLLLGSLWALIPAGLTVVLLAVRTALEDRMLLEGLPGYSEYAHKTLYRLVPGIW